MNPFLILHFLLSLAFFSQPKPHSDYARDWKRADSLAAKGLPKSALEIANRIYTEAKAQKNYPQVAKAAIARMNFRSYSDEDTYKELVSSLQADILDTPEPAKSVLYSVLGDIYWQYFQQNRYKFYNRTAVNTTDGTNAGQASDDFTTWDARRLVDAITSAYLSSVQSKELLQKTPIATYDALLIKGDSDARLLRPTLYDLLAHRAIAFFQNTESDLIKPVFRFELDQPTYLAEPGVFVKVSLKSLDSLSGRYQALRLYQDLLAFHLSDKNSDALVDADVLRLSFVHRHSVLPDRDTLYRKTLDKQIATYKNQPAEAVYSYELAEFLVNANRDVQPLDNDMPTDTVPNPRRWNNKQAADICRDIVKRFPKTRSAKQAEQLLNQLTLATYSVQLEQVNAPNQAFRALVSYQNTSKVLYRISQISTSEFQSIYDDTRSQDQKRKQLSAWLKRPVVAEKNVTLPDDGDLSRHSVELPLAGLPIGHYVLLSTSDEKFQDKSESVQYTPFTVSTLSYLLKPSVGNNENQTVSVANRLTGEPINDASVVIISAQNLSWLKDYKALKTDANGWVKIPADDLPKQSSVRYLITVGKDTLVTDQQYYYRNDPQPEQAQTYAQLFTDRAIYRPGQPIYVKGLVYEGKTNQFSVRNNLETSLDFLDQNGENIASQKLKTNEFGTFTATLTAPVGRLTGQMTLQTPFGSTNIQVEEYKRPTFEVKTKPIKQSFKLGQTITLSADAKTFSGAVVDGAEVRYRVTRQLRPRWDWWYVSRSFISRQTSPTEIANGKAQTDANGNVAVTFTAVPDRDQSLASNPVFDFEVIIDVTDKAGETRSTTQTLRIGYSALQISLTVPPQVEVDQPATFPVRITNQSGEKVAAKAQLMIYRLQPPSRPLRARLWQQPDRQLMSKEEFNRLFPNDVYANENDPRFWPKGELIQQQTITSPADSLVKPDLSRYTPGEYVIEVAATDSAGSTNKEHAYFSVVNDRQPTASARPDSWIQVRKASGVPGEEAVFWVGNGQAGWVLMTVEQDHRIVREEWLKTEKKPSRVALPISEQQRGGFAVHFTMIQNGRLYQKSQTISVPFTNKELTIETQTFRSKLKPGEREEWTLIVKGLDKASAELVATLYDASLDAFTKLEWPNSFYQPYSPVFYGWRSGAFGQQPSNVLFFQNRYVPPVPIRRYDQLRNYVATPHSRYKSGVFGRIDEDLQVVIHQSKSRIYGTVKDNGGNGAPGVVVQIKGKGKSAVTDVDGQFNIEGVPMEKPVSLVFSFIGYLTKEVKLAGESLSFTWPGDVSALNEVTVVGYSTQKRSDVTGAVAPRMSMAKMAAPMAAGADEVKPDVGKSGQTDSKSAPEPLINPRRNFNETAFFMPQLKTDEQGRVVMKFTMPDALTRWRLLAFAHTKELKIGSLEREIITQKELMITANAPRFFREGDTIRVTARVNNLSDRSLPVVASLNLLDGLTGEPVNQKLSHAALQTSANVAAGQGQAVGWTLVVPAGLEAVTCRLTAQSGTFTDGEEFAVPVLPNRMLITDSQPFWVNGKGTGAAGTKTFTLKPLTNLNPELPVRHERLTVEVTSNPNWYALQSLPYLMDYRYECAEQLFSRLYANSLAAHIVGSKPAFKQVIADWQKNPPKGPLETNAELKAVSLENSPWLADARSEAERQARLGLLLDANRMENEQVQTFEKLKQLQTGSGGFRWFSGMGPDLTMTLHILSGFGHLQKLGVRFPDELLPKISEMQASAIHYVDEEMKRWMEEQRKLGVDSKAKHISPAYFVATQFLYARSFYLNKPVDKTLQAYLQKYVADKWLQQSLQGQALAAMALFRYGDAKTANGIVASLREHAKKGEELGMYWPDNQSGLNWYQTPIETQAYLIEAFGEVNPVSAEIDDMKRWLLRQKQTQSWSSTKATTEAIYALLLRGSDWLGTGVSTQVSLGGKPIENRVTKADAITGYEKVTYAASEIKPDMGVIQVTKNTAGPAWGALYWQHFESLDQVMPGSAGLSVQKTLYVQRDSPNGPAITPVTSKTRLKPGDLIKIRIILKTDRAMEYVHLKDGRASGFEPVAALSGYKFQNGLGYYESPRDASTDFFMSYVPVGTHVFEYDLRVAQAGDFSAGVATVQCFYAPEFSAHSAGGRVKVN